MSAEHSEAEEARGSIEYDPLYAEALNRMQEGQWEEAVEALATLETRYPDSGELRRLRQTLAFRLSAEESWHSATDQGVATILRRPLVRALLIVNLVLYVLLGVVWLLGQFGGLLP